MGNVLNYLSWVTGNVGFGQDINDARRRQGFDSISYENFLSQDRHYGGRVNNNSIYIIRSFQLTIGLYVSIVKFIVVNQNYQIYPLCFAHCSDVLQDKCFKIFNAYRPNSPNFTNLPSYGVDVKNSSIIYSSWCLRSVLHVMSFFN